VSDVNGSQAKGSDVNGGSPLAPRIVTVWGSFAFVAVFLGVIGLIYTLATDDPTGRVLLFLGSGFAAIVAVYLWWSARSVRRAGGDERAPEPHATDTITPAFTGAGMALLAVGAVAGIWIFVPGLLVLGAAIVMFLRERD
jgi:hypothetical protein